MHKLMILAPGLACLGALACVQQPGPAPEQTAARAAQPKPGGAVNVRIQLDPFDWDLSYTAKAQPNKFGTALAYETLVALKHGPEVDYAENMQRPGLAERWVVSPDAKTFTFHLRQGVKFANLPPVNARVFTAADVKFSFEYWSRTGEVGGRKLPQGQFAWMFEGLEALDTPDASTIVARFKQPFVPFLGYASAGEGIPIVPREVFDADGDFRNRIVGTGPFQLDLAAGQKGTRYVWKKNPTYWEQGKPYLDEVRWLTIRDDATAHAAFKTKQLDIIDEVESDVIERIRVDNPNAEVYGYVLPGAASLSINTRVPPFDDIRIRKALSLGIDREEFVKVRTNGKGWPALAGAPAGVFFTADESRKLLPYDPEEARRLVREAGYPNGLTVTMTHAAPDYGHGYLTSLELMQAQLKKVAINLDLQSLDKSSFSDNRKKGQFIINLNEGATIVGDVDSWLYATWYPGSQANYNGVNDPRVKELLDAEVGTVDPGKRKELLREAIRYINSEKYWGLSIYYLVQNDIWQPWVKNYRPNFWIAGHPLTNSWVER